MALTSDAKFGENMTVGSENDMGNLVNFNVSNSENLPFDVLLLSIAFKVPAKKIQRNYFS